MGPTKPCVMRPTQSCVHASLAHMVLHVMFYAITGLNGLNRPGFNRPVKTWF